MGAGSALRKDESRWMAARLALTVRMACFQRFGRDGNTGEFFDRRLETLVFGLQQVLCRFRI